MAGGRLNRDTYVENSFNPSFTGIALVARPVKQS